MAEILDSDAFDLLSSSPRPFAATPTVSDPSTVSDTESILADSLLSTPSDREQSGQGEHYSLPSSSNPASETASPSSSQLFGSDDPSDWDMDVDEPFLADHHDYARESSEESLFVGEDFDGGDGIEGFSGDNINPINNPIYYQLPPLSRNGVDGGGDLGRLYRNPRGARGARRSINYQIPPLSSIGLDQAENEIDELVGMEVHNPRDRQRHQRQPRAQPEVIDLTGDVSSPQAVPQHASQNARRRQSQRNSPPRLSRSDASYVGERTVIDLVSDSDDEPQAIGMPPLRGNDRPRPPRRVPTLPPLQNVPEVGDRGAQRRVADQLGLGGFQQQIQRYIGGIHNHMENIPLFDWLNSSRIHGGGDDVVLVSHRQILPADNPARPDRGQQPFAPVQLDYNVHPFQNQPPPPVAGGGTPKPAHEPPKETRPGFTRNTAEDVIAICPSCEKELAYEDGDGATSTPAKKARSKKDKAEHHFWAVKACGHVYCRKCFEHRKPTGKNPPPVGFRPDPSGAKNKMLCAVEDCESEVSSKSVWVGIFM